MQSPGSTTPSRLREEMEQGLLFSVTTPSSQSKGEGVQGAPTSESLSKVSLAPDNTQGCWLNPGAGPRAHAWDTPQA